MLPVLSSVGVEDLSSHILWVNWIELHLAVELSSVVLIGTAKISGNSEYRPYTIPVSAVHALFAKKGGLFARVYKCVTDAANPSTGRVHNTKDSMYAVTADGLRYAVVHYLLLRAKGELDKKYIRSNYQSPESLCAIVRLINWAMAKAKVGISETELAEFVADTLTIPVARPRGKAAQAKAARGVRVGSKLMLLTNLDVRDSSNLSGTVWKESYIHTLLRNLPAQHRLNIFSIMIDWALLRGSVRPMVANSAMVKRLAEGEGMHFIHLNSHRQLQVADLIFLDDDSSTARYVRGLIAQVNEVTYSYTSCLPDIAMVAFYEDAGRSLFAEVRRFVAESLRLKTLATDTTIGGSVVPLDEFRQLVLRILYGLFLLAKSGVAHYDMHLDNVMMQRGADFLEPQEFDLLDGAVATLRPMAYKLSIVDFGNSVLTSAHNPDEFPSKVDSLRLNANELFKKPQQTRFMSKDPDQLGVCFGMHDVMRFCTNLKFMLDDVQEDLGEPILGGDYAFRHHITLLHNLAGQSGEIVHELYKTRGAPAKKSNQFDFKTPGAGMAWLIREYFPDDVRVPTKKEQAAIVKPAALEKPPAEAVVSSKPHKVADAAKKATLARYAASLAQSYSI